MYYHASPVGGIRQLEPRISNHGDPLIYFSRKRENVLVYLSNAIEKYCRETGFVHQGPWQKWGPYGFDRDGIQRLEEYYPDALIKTYKGVSGYIYGAKSIREAAFAVGPEGGFSPAELESARALGWRDARIGPRVLRTETAGLAAAVMAGTLSGDLLG